MFNLKLKIMKKLLLLSVVTVLIMSGCADVESTKECLPNDPYGFWSGLWHGMIAPFAFIGSLIWDDIAVYAVNNTGSWYDFGFILGIGGFTSSASASSKRRR